MLVWFFKLPLVEKLGWSILVLIPLSIIVCVLYFGLSRFRGWQTLNAIEEAKDRISLKIEIIKTAASIFGGIFLILTIVVAFLNYLVTQEKNTTDLYTKTIEQLGSDKLEVRLGGIYALESIAKDSKNYRRPILEVFTAYIRANAPWPPEDFKEAKRKRSWAKPRPYDKTKKKYTSTRGKGGTPNPAKIPKLDPDIQAILTSISSRKIELGEAPSLDLSNTDLREANLKEAQLEDATLWEAHLEGADLRNANLKGAMLLGAHLEGTILLAAHLEAAILRKAHLEGAMLWEAHLESASLWEAHLEGAYLKDAHLDGIILWDAHLEGADLSNATGLTQRQIDRAYCDNETKLSLGLKLPRKKKPLPW